MPIKVASIVQFIRDKGARDAEPNDRGNHITRLFMPDERYTIDFAPDFTAEGWMQFDTDQDAAYFGVWVNPTKRLTLTYTEGDWTLVECEPHAGEPTHDRYNLEIQSCIDFYGEGQVASCYGKDGSSTIVRQDRSRFFVQPGEEPQKPIGMKEVLSAVLS